MIVSRVIRNSALLCKTPTSFQLVSVRLTHCHFSEQLQLDLGAIFHNNNSVYFSCQGDSFDLFWKIPLLLKRIVHMCSHFSPFSLKEQFYIFYRAVKNTSGYFLSLTSGIYRLAGGFEGKKTNPAPSNTELFK